MTRRFQAETLRAFGQALLEKTGIAADKAAIVADILLEGDLMGHSTHGLQLLPRYLEEAAEGRMAGEGAPEVLSERGAALLWDGKHLPGPWLVVQAMEALFEKARTQGSATAVIRRSHHIGALAPYMKRATDRGYACLLTCSDPAVASVAPHGATTGVYTPNPIAAGWPTSAGPVWIDISASTTTNGMLGRLNRLGGKLPGKWLISEAGEATDDPSVMAAGRRGAILPLGGMDLGYKGFALGLIVEAFTSGLGGFGRADHDTRWGASVFVLMLDPDAFGGRAAFERETGWLAEACRKAPPRPGSEGARMPGEPARALREEQLRLGVALHPEILPALKPWAEKLGVPLPR